MAQEGDLVNIIIGFGLFVLFSLSIFVVVTEMSTTYNISSETALAPIDVGGFNLIAERMHSDAKDWDDKFGGGESEESQTGFGKFIGFIGGEIFSTARRTIILVTAPFSLISNILLFLGFPTWIVNGILSILIVFLMYATWRLMKIGS